MKDAQDLVDGIRELEGSANDYHAAMSYYLGDVPEKFASDKVRNKVGGSGEHYKVNVTRCVIDSLIDRLAIAAVTALTAQGKEYPEAQQALDAQIWTPNKLDRQIPRLVRDTSVYGDGYLYFWRNADEDRRPLQVSYNSPLTTRVIYDTEDEMDPLYAVKRWEGRDNADKANLITDEEVVRYVRDPRGKWDDPGAWREEGRVGHDHGRIPVEHFSTWLPYGRPEHKDAYGPQNAISKLAPTMVDSAEQAGYPARYALASPDASVRGDNADGFDYDDDDPQDMTKSGARPSKVKAGPGEVAVMEGIAQAGQWSAAESSTFTDSGNWFLRVMAQSTTTPFHLLDPSGSVPSGDSRRIADAPLDSKVGLRRPVYGSGLSSVLAAGLLSLGYDASVRVRWKPSPVTDDAATWSVCEAKIRSGVPQDVALAETGLYEPDQVGRWMESDRAQMDVMHRVQLLADLAQGIQGIGQAVALDVMTPEQAQAAVASVLGPIMKAVEAA